MTDKIEKFISSLSAKQRQRLKERLVRLKSSPFAGSDIKKLKSFDDKTFRLRSGKIRIIYKVDPQGIIILDIDYRGNIY